MEIHAPKPVHSLREFAKELGTITAGILIALSLEGAVEWRHHRELVKEARENLVHEIQDNQKEIEGLAKVLPSRQQQLERAVQFYNDQLDRKQSPIHNLEISYSLAGLSQASWDTAQATGALSYMDYAEVKRYADAYHIQQQFDRLQERVVENYILAIRPFAGGDPTKASARDLEGSRQQTLLTLTYLRAESDISKGLMEAYRDALKPKR